MRLPLRNINLPSLGRLVFSLTFAGIGFYRLIAHHFYPGHPFLTLINTLGLIALGGIIFLGIFVRFTKTVFFLFAALVYAIFIDEGWLSPLNAQRIATLVILFFVGYFFYKFVRILLLARKDSIERGRSRSDFGTVASSPTLPADSPYHSHLENKEFLLRDMSRSKKSSLMGFPGAWGTRWHFGPLWFENFFGDVEPPHGTEGPLRVIIWQPMRDVAATPGWRHTRMLKYNHMTGFATLTGKTQENYWREWSDHAKRHRKKWLAASELEIYQPTAGEFFQSYRRSSQNILLKFYFVNLLKQLLISHGKQIVFSAVRRKGTEGPMLAGFVAHDIPEARTSRHIASFIHADAKHTPVGIGLMDAWFRESIHRGYDYLDFGVFWMPGDPESWKGFSRFKGQFGITYIQYPPARLRRAGSWRGLFKR